MRGRKPHVLVIASEDVPVLEHVARCRKLPWFQVERARILLAVAAGQRVETLTAQFECDRATVWRVCRRYEQLGLNSVFGEAPRSGRPLVISPPAARTDC
jgi:hypothetical protein